MGIVERLLNAKSILAFKLALATSPVMFVIEKYIFRDWEFLRWVIILICLDLIWALRVAWKKRNISLRGFEKSGEKLAQYATLLILGHVLLHVKSANEPITVLSYFTLIIHTYIVSREILSILEKQILINPKYVPNWLLQRLKTFNETGKTEDLQAKDHEKTTEN
jgi:hypothetical protein